MGRLPAVWSVVARRSAGNWKMLAVLALGIVVAATLLAAAPVYARAMSDLGLTFTIDDQLAGRPASHIEFRALPLGTAEGSQVVTAAEARIQERVGWFSVATGRRVTLGRFSIARQNENPPFRSVMGQPQWLEGYRDKVRLVEGRFPEGGDASKPMEVLMGVNGAALMRLKVGETFRVSEDFDTCFREIPTEEIPPPPPICNPGAVVHREFLATLVGIAEPADPDDPFWVSGAERHFEPAPRVLPDAGPIVPMLIEEAAVAAYGAQFPGSYAIREWNLTADSTRLTRANFERAQDDERQLNDEMWQLGGFAYSPLTDALKDYGRSSSFQQKPLTILLLEIAAIAVFYVSLVAGIVIERQSREIALFQGRGASVGQVVFAYLLEGLAVGVPVVLVAPFIAAAATALLGLTPLFEDVSGGDLLPVTVPALSFGMAGIGVGLALLALLVPAWSVARKGALAQRRAESRPGPGLIQRYYLDVVLALFAALLLWELHERGSVFTPSAAGGVSSDPVLLASPALIIAAAAAVTLRLYPLMLRLLARSLAAISGVTVAIGLWQVVRNPSQHTRLTLLLMMAVAVGTFAASYSSTAEQSYEDRANFEVGVEFRATGGDGLAVDPVLSRFDERLAAIPGVERASATSRWAGSLSAGGPGGQTIQLLGVDPSAAGDMLWFRDDFANRPLREVLAPLEGGRKLAGRPLPAGTTEISLWVNPQTARESVTAWARVRDSENRLLLVDLGKLEGEGWREMRGGYEGRGLVGALTVLAIVFTGPPNVFALNSAPVYVDDLGAVSASGQVTVIDGFEEPAAWGVLPVKTNNRDALTVNAEKPHSGKLSGRFTFGTGAGESSHGFFASDPSVPFPVVAAKDLLTAAGLSVGSTGFVILNDALIPVVIRGEFDLFPTAPTKDGWALVMNREQLVSWMDMVGDNGRKVVNEAWLSLEPGADTDAIEVALRKKDFGFTSVLDRKETLDTVQKNPLIAAGGTGILVVAFLSVLILVGAAVLVTLWTVVQRRRVEFAVMRAIGLSRGQIARVLALEYGMVGVVGVAIGAYLGLLVGRQMLSFLNVTETGSKVEPGFVLQTEWSFVAVGGGAVVAIFLVALVVAVRVLARTSDAQALRTE